MPIAGGTSLRRRPPRVPQLQDGLQHLLPAGQALIASCAALRCPSKACPAGGRDPMAVLLDHHVARRQRLKLAARAQTLDRRQQPAGRLGGLHRRLGEVEDNDDCEPADGGEPADCESADVGNCLASMAGRSLVMSCPPASPWLLEHCDFLPFRTRVQGRTSSEGRAPQATPPVPTRRSKGLASPRYQEGHSNPNTLCANSHWRTENCRSGRRGKTRDSRRDG